MTRRGGGTPLYYPYRYVPPQRVWFWLPFGLKTGTDFAHFGLESFMGYKGVYVVYELACENIRFPSLFAAKDVSRGGTSATQRQKFHTDDAEST